MTETWTGEATVKLQHTNSVDVGFLYILKVKPQFSDGLNLVSEKNKGVENDSNFLSWVPRKMEFSSTEKQETMVE